MSDFAKALEDNKETLKLLGSALPGAFAVAKTVYEFIQSRDSKRDKILARIQGLMAVREALGPETEANGRSLADINAQISEAVARLATTERAVEEKKAVEETLTWFQRAFLLYRPETWRAWIAHITAWLFALMLPLAVFGMAFPEGNGDPAWTAFLENMKDSATYIGLLFFIGMFLLARLWGMSEHKRYLRIQDPSAPNQTRAEVVRVAPRKGIRIFAVLAIFYGIFGIACLVGAGIAVQDDRRAAIKFGLFGIVVLACIPALLASGKRADLTHPLTMAREILILLPTILLAVTVLFDIQGIILKRFSGDPLAYWRSWITEPGVPLFFVPIAGAPLFAGLRCLITVAKAKN